MKPDPHSLGGVARAKALSSDERSAIAKSAAKARWKNNPKPWQKAVGLLRDIHVLPPASASKYHEALDVIVNTLIGTSDE